MKESLELVFPTLKDKEKVLDYRQEFFNHNEPIIHGGAFLDSIDSYEKWLDQVEKSVNLDTVPSGLVQSATFLVIRASDQKMVGIIQLRYELNEALKNYGHCGYSVRPSERKKGYATNMLSQIVKKSQEAKMDHLQLSASQSNLPSIQTILKNGGQYQWSFSHELEPANVYFIFLQKNQSK